jgi:3-mercaptopyruvate sulfurtransferase SseA
MSITGSMICTGATMDSIVQNAGIDANTTIVITTGYNQGSATATPSQSFVNTSRAYASFRYWGFPKNRIKVLQGGNEAWAAVSPLVKTATVVPKSTYGVAQNGVPAANTAMRVSLPEMISYVKGIVAGNSGKVVIVDTVRPATNTTSTTDLLESGYTVFEGAMKGSYRFPAPELAPNNYYLDTAAVKAKLSAGSDTSGTGTMGDSRRDTAKTFISICRAGNYASVGFFALDGIAYYNSDVEVKWYDGSYGQWNLLASSDHVALNGQNAGGKLKVGSIWDTHSLMDNLTWTKDINPARTIVNYGYRVYSVEPSYAEGNQIEVEDSKYRSAGGAAGGSSGGGGC